LVQDVGLRTRASDSRSHKVSFVLAILLILVASLFSFFSTQHLIALSAQARQGDAALLEVNRLVSYLKDVETGVRGYVITADRRYLEPYESGRQGFADTLLRLEALAPAAEVHAGVEQLRQDGRERIAIARTVIDRRGAGASPQSLLPALASGKAAMDRIRAAADRVIAVEQAVAQARQQAVVRQARLTNLVLALSVLASLAAIVWMFRLRDIELVRGDVAQDALRGRTSELEDRVAERAAEVVRYQVLLEAVIENMPDAVFLKDATDGNRYLLLNGAGERLYGRPRDAVIGFTDEQVLPRELLRASDAADAAVLAERRPQVTPDQVWRIGDTYHRVESRRIPIDDAAGELRFILGVLRDVTEGKALEDRVRELQRMDAIGQLTGGIAHDFNNLLAVIMTNVEMLREDVAASGGSVDLADEAIGAVARGAELVRRLLAFARKQHLDPSAVDINERLPGVAALLRRTLGEKVSLQVQLASDLWPAMIDPTQVDDALMNLAINARDAMAGGGTLTVETANVTLETDYTDLHADVAPGDYVLLAVSDTGSGMSPETIARAFEPFYTTKAPGKGTGLGLSQVYGWVKQSGGHIKIYSELGVGTSIKLYLPRAGAHAAAAPEPDAPEPMAGGSETILVVEDNPDVRRAAVRQLQGLGYAVVEASDAREAIGRVREGLRFDLLLTDVVMPGGMTGYELAIEVDKLRPGTRVLFTSGYTELAAPSADAPRGALLSKPYRRIDLDRAVRQALDKPEPETQASAG
jgi:PAS domain S-box-containing protein